MLFTVWKAGFASLRLQIFTESMYPPTQRDRNLRDTFGHSEDLSQNRKRPKHHPCTIYVLKTAGTCEQS